MDNTNFVKVFFELPHEWHGYSTESLYTKKISGNEYSVENIPFFIKGISLNDIISVKKVNDGRLFFKEVVKYQGHSTYRIILKSGGDIRIINSWRDLKSLGCTYEKGQENLFTIDVPSEADIYKAYDLLEKGEKMGIWHFEEGHCGHLLT